jgi:hypothetical protein
MSQVRPKKGHHVYSNLELLGLLSPRMLHDVKNKMAIITGHAQFAEIAQFDHQKLKETISTIRRIGEETNRYLESMSRMRRELPTEPPVSSLEDVRTVVEHVLKEMTGWTLSFAAKGDVALAVPRRHIEFLFVHALATSGMHAGSVTVTMRPLREETTDPLALDDDTQALKISLVGKRPPDFKPPAEDAQIKLEEMVFGEILSRSSGGVRHQALPDDHHEVVLRFACNSAGETGKK